jgi:NADH dehydrogenase FAD-containing subunit
MNNYSKRDNSDIEKLQLLPELYALLVNKQDILLPSFKKELYNQIEEILDDTMGIVKNVDLT